MPIKHGALRQIKKTHVRELRNRDVKSELKTLKKQFLQLLNQRKRDEALKLLPTLMRKFDQAASKKMIHANTASRIKSRLMYQLSKTQAS